MNKPVRAFAYRQYAKYMQNYSVKRDLSEDDLCRLVCTIYSHAQPSRYTLDLGCGAGQLLTHLAASNPGSQFLGVDVNKQVIMQARSRIREKSAPNCELVVADGENLPFRKECLALILLMQTLHHFARTENLAHEIRESLASGGTIAVASCSHDQIRSSFDIVNFPGVLKNELRRIPDVTAIKKLFSVMGFQLTAYVEFAWPHRFASYKHLTDWIASVPFSTYAILSTTAFRKGLAIFENRLREKYGNAEIVWLFCETIQFFRLRAPRKNARDAKKGACRRPHGDRKSPVRTHVGRHPNT